MATSGTYNFNPLVAELVDEAFERCKVDPATLAARHNISARRSFNFMFSDWETKGRMQWKAQEETHTPTAVGENNFTLSSAAIIDVEKVMLSRDDKETEMERKSRSDWRTIYDKTITGRPHLFFLDRQITPVMYYWFAAENTTDVIKFDAFYRIEDVDALNQEVEVPSRWYEAVASGLAAKLAVKFAPERVEMLTTLADSAHRSAKREEDSNADLVITPVYDT